MRKGFSNPNFWSIERERFCPHTRGVQIARLAAEAEKVKIKRSRSGEKERNHHESLVVCHVGFQWTDGRWAGSQDDRRLTMGMGSKKYELARLKKELDILHHQKDRGYRLARYGKGVFIVLFFPFFWPFHYQ